MRKLGAVLIACVLAVPMARSAAFAQDSDPEAEKAAREIADARDRANAAAEAWAAAQSQLDELEVQRAQVEHEIVGLQAAVDELRSDLDNAVVQQFMQAGSRGVPMLSGFQGAADAAQAEVLIGIVNETAAVTFDDYEQADKELVAKREELARTTQEVEAASEALVRRQAELEDEIERLKATEAKRLQDEAVRKALEAEEAERRRKEQEAAERAAAEAAAAAAARAQQAAANTQPSAGPQGGSNGGGGSGGSSDTPATTQPAGSDDSGTNAGGGSSSGGSGGATGGTTGGGGTGGLNSSTVVGAGQDWVCPVNGPRAFADTFGAPRSGGRQHQGVDIINPRGTPIVAVVDGFVQQKQNALGGNALWLTGNDGNKYYYAHLDSYAAAGAVSKGETIGYNGDTGNAKGTPHLHLQIHPGGGAAINPYPTVRAHC